ncbi:MAG: SDR family NAD(P)-dependent oxidoreductase [Candidatus Omnitrophica bacterium]|nr:SDR family NAD(P)-dependent oxidoreductase [Candidatus Omnitrophota bacterium]
MNWASKRVLVTGAGGFIGSHLTERLVTLGANPRAFVRYQSNGSWGWLDTISCKDELEVIAGDIRDRDSVAQAMDGMEIVVHLAALIAIPYSYQTPESYLETNIGGTLNVLRCARASGVERIVHTSTSEVYGTARAIPINEGHPLHAQSPYAASKTGADQLIESLTASWGLPVVTIRPFNTFGPRQSARAIIPTIVTQCLAGQTVRLGNIHPTRDFTYVTDTVEGFVQAASAADVVGRTIHLGSGRETRIEALARLIADLVDKPITIEIDDERLRPASSEVERLVADATLAGTLLGWEPSVPLEEGLGMTIEWIREHLDGYRPGVYVR